MQHKAKSKEYIAIECKIEPVLKEYGFSIVDVEVRKEKSLSISIFVFHSEKSEMNIDRLADVNRKIYPMLETIDFLAEGFSLEVSSPGIFRKLNSMEEFSIFQKRTMKITIQDGTEILGICNGIVEDEKISITKTDTEETLLLEANQIKKASLIG